MMEFTFGAYAGVRGYWVISSVGRAGMPAYIRHHDVEPDFIICPSCVGLPMFLSHVQPHWSMAKIEFTYECSECGAVLRQTIITPPMN